MRRLVQVALLGSVLVGCAGSAPAPVQCPAVVVDPGPPDAAWEEVARLRGLLAERALVEAFRHGSDYGRSSAESGDSPRTVAIDSIASERLGIMSVELSDGEHPRDTVRAALEQAFDSGARYGQALATHGAAGHATVAAGNAWSTALSRLVSGLQ